GGEADQGSARRSAEALVFFAFAVFAFADFFGLLRAFLTVFFGAFFLAVFFSTLLAAGLGGFAAAAAVPARIATSERERTRVRSMLPLGTAYIIAAQHLRITRAAHASPGSMPTAPRILLRPGITCARSSRRPERFRRPRTRREPPPHGPPRCLGLPGASRRQ